MQSYDDKVDAAVHAAFMALGLPVATNMDLAIRLNDFITQEFAFAVIDDESGADGPALPHAPGTHSSPDRARQW
ncbi:hypothetical protein [Haematobacter missouriensis]|uniref:Uncharacterized protein n=1 Tax=Haematobacter missouriensis TaxID=366616 RepID=A0ABX3ZQC0_9RHOB|nr:hypothetical protein [Haematobacter missouriensis]OWJ73347.1 hypothetical protein CDV53_15835 [Haematobacter missouriensis]